MKVGDIVQPIHNEREKYLSTEFIKWIDRHADIKFYVSKVFIDGSVRLSKVDFVITQDFLKIV